MTETIEAVAEIVQKTEIQKRIESFLSPGRTPIVEGWTTVEKANAMADLVLANRPSLIVQIGVFGGASLIPQALALQQNGHGLIIGIDPWTKAAALEGDVGADNAEWWSKLDMDAIANGAWAAIDSEGVKDFAVLVRTQSHIVSGLFPPESIDILEIDGNHSELASCRDVNLYLPLVKPGGFIWFDDFKWDSTQKAMGFINAQCKEMSRVDSCALFQKV